MSLRRVYYRLTGRCRTFVGDGEFCEICGWGLAHDFKEFR